MSTCATKHALSIVNRVPWVIDDAGEVAKLIDTMVGRVTECNVEVNRAIELCREGFIDAYPWMGLAQFPAEWAGKLGAASAWVDHYERRYGPLVDVPEVARERFEPCSHPAYSGDQIMVQTNHGPMPLSAIPEPLRSIIRQQMGLDDDD